MIKKIMRSFFVDLYIAYIYEWILYKFNIYVPKDFISKKIPAYVVFKYIKIPIFHYIFP